MFFFGHLGITFGIALLFFRVLKIDPDQNPNHRLYPAVLIGAILPDLIDKPIGEILLADSISHGRLFAHTLLFVFILFLIGIYLYKEKGRIDGFVLSGATFMHLLQDKMWLTPETFFYPAFGFTVFPQGVVETHWWDFFLTAFFYTYPSYLTAEISSSFLFEVVGISILALFCVQRISTRMWRLRE
ncbi:MAG: metal-dependent hydrolase [Methanophagales archaeon]|nr:metal-dependent hydrolase [Methanophagales archaeon]